MKKEFISKLKTKNYLIGSFDVYQEVSKKIIQKNSNLSEEETERILKSMPTTSRAAITNKKGKYIGYIGLFDIDAKNNISSIRFETKITLSKKDVNEILDEFKKYIYDSLNITYIREIVYTSIEELEYVPRK